MSQCMILEIGRVSTLIIVGRVISISYISRAGCCQSWLVEWKITPAPHSSAEMPAFAFLLFFARMPPPVFYCTRDPTQAERRKMTKPHSVDELATPTRHSKWKRSLFWHHKAKCESCDVSELAGGEAQPVAERFMVLAAAAASHFSTSRFANWERDNAEFLSFVSAKTT